MPYHISRTQVVFRPSPGSLVKGEETASGSIAPKRVCLFAKLEKLALFGSFPFQVSHLEGEPGKAHEPFMVTVEKVPVERREGACA